MRRSLLPVSAAMLLVFALSSVALGAKPAHTCGAAASGYFVVDRDQWWDITVIGFEKEDIAVYQGDGETFTAQFDGFAAAVGFGDGAGLEYFVRVSQWAGIDHNDNGYVCMKYRPHTPGNPYYFFNGVDDQGSSPWGDSAT